MIFFLNMIKEVCLVPIKSCHYIRMATLDDDMLYILSRVIVRRIVFYTKSHSSAKKKFIPE